MADSPDRIERLARLANEKLGLNLERGAVAAALERYAECFGEDVLDTAADAQVFQNFVAAVTVQHSWLFRDQEQLELACRLLQEAVPTRATHAVWVPACATGEDVYSLLALAEARAMGMYSLGTDVHAQAIEHSRRAVYGEASIRHVPLAFRGMLEGNDERAAIVGRLRRRAQFDLHNLLEAAPSSPRADGKWDLILCRNVLIYFSPERSQRALQLLLNALAPGGTLILGASDILTELPAGLVAVEVGGRIVFRHAEPGRPPATPARPNGAKAEPSRAPKAEPARAAGAKVEPSRAPAPAPDELSAVVGDDDERIAVEHLLTGIDFQLVGELTRALGEFRAALYLKPDLWPASYYLASCLDGLGRHRDASRAYDLTCQQLELARPTPNVPGHDFSFLRRDVARIAQQRARRP